MIVEGVSSTDVRVPVPWDLTLWVEASPEVRWQRILDRDEPELLERWRTDWLPNEEAYAAEQRPWERVDAIVSVSPGTARPDRISLRSWHSWRRQRTRPTGQRSTPQTKIIKAMWPTTQGFSLIGRTSIAPGRHSTAAVKSNMSLERFEVATIAAAQERGSSYCALAHGRALSRALDVETVVHIAERHRRRPGA